MKMFVGFVEEIGFWSISEEEVRAVVAKVTKEYSEEDRNDVVDFLEVDMNDPNLVQKFDDIAIDLSLFEDWKESLEKIENKLQLQKVVATTFTNGLFEVLDGDDMSIWE